VLQNLDILNRADPNHVLVLGGDHIYKMDYGRILAEHVARSADVTVACIEVPLAEASRFGLVTVNKDGWITEFHEKPRQPTAMTGKPDRALASMGIYVFNSHFLYQQLLRDAADTTSAHDFGKDIIPHLVGRHRVLAHHFADSCVNMVGDVPYWRDVGTVDAYWEANIDLTMVTPELNLYEEAWPIWSLQQQLPPAKFVFDDDWRRGYAVDSLVSGGCIISGAMIRRSLLSTKVQVCEHSSVDESVILPNVQIGRNVTLKRAVVDKGCVIPDGFTAGVDATQDRQRFHVTESGITLITPEMLGQQIHQMH
jgi:glucose-1-phosphate adenylyltransferase